MLVESFLLQSIAIRQFFGAKGKVQVLNSKAVAAEGNGKRKNPEPSSGKKKSKKEENNNNSVEVKDEKEANEEFIAAKIKSLGYLGDAERYGFACKLYSNRC